MATNTDRISLNKGYTEKGFANQVYHIHLRYIGDNDELYFRDYLSENPQIAKEYEALKLELWKRYEHNRDAYTDAKYEALKLELWKRYEHNRDAYTDAKTDFIREYTEKARKKYGDRYSR